MKKQRVLILGAGFGGLRAALDLSRRSFGNIAITLIDKNPYHSFSPDFYEIASAFIPENTPIRAEDFSLVGSAAKISLEEILKGRKNISFVIGEVATFHPKEKEVVLVSGECHSYDWLIIALGSETNYFSIPKLKECAYGLKTFEEAMNIRNAVDELFSRKAKHEMIRIVIGGGGFAGCELASELTGYAEKLLKTHSHPRGNFEIVLVEAKPDILSSARKSIQKKTLARLRRLGIKVLTSSSIAGVEAGKVMLKVGKTIEEDLLIWTAGVSASSVINVSGDFGVEKGGCLATDKYLRVKPHGNIFAIGDIAYCYDPRTEMPVPMTARTALHQARYVAYTIYRMINKRRPFPYIPNKSKYIVSLGFRYALADMGWIRLSGILAWALKRLVALDYLLSILPAFRAFVLWMQATKIYKRND